MVKSKQEIAEELKEKIVAELISIYEEKERKLQDINKKIAELQVKKYKNKERILE